MTVSSLITDRAGLAAHAKTKLGYPKLCVELDDSHFDAAVDEAEVWLATYMGEPIKRQYTITLVAGQSEYKLPSDCSRVIDIAYPEDNERIYSGFSFVDGIEDYLLGSQFGGGSSAGSGMGGFYSSLYQHLQGAEEARRVLSADTDWTWDHSTATLHIQPDVLSGPAIVWYHSCNFNYERLEPRHIYLMKRYVIAQSKMMLGNIRSKFQSIPSGSSTSITLNGSELTSQAETELDRLQEMINAHTEPLGFTTG